MSTSSRLPFVFRNEAHMRKVIDGAIGDELLGQDHGQPGTAGGPGWMDSGSRSLYTKKPVRSMEDLKGQKILRHCILPTS